jgi:hypothetical protein
VTGAAKRCARNTSKRIGEPSLLVRSGKPYFSRALLLVTNGSLFWIVAVGPENTAMRGLAWLYGSVIVNFKTGKMKFT